jgi:hypothetical protein
VALSFRSLVRLLPLRVVVFAGGDARGHLAILRPGTAVALLMDVEPALPLGQTGDGDLKRDTTFAFANDHRSDLIGRCD